MTNWYNIFYWLTVADGVKGFFDAVSNIFTTFAVILGILWIGLLIARAVNVDYLKLRDKEQEKVNPTMRGIDWAKKYSSISFYICLGLAIVMWICYVLVPTKKDCLLIIAGGAVGNFITSDSSSKALPADITEYLHLSLRDEIKSLRTDVKKDLGMQSKKENLIDKVKNIGDDALKKELLEYINGDSVNKTPK